MTSRRLTSATPHARPGVPLWRRSLEKAKATLPECNGRVEKAAVIVLNGDVELLAEGKAKVASQSNGTKKYFLVNGTCPCLDFPKAPSGWCKHRIAAGMQKRASALAKAMLEAGANGQASTPAQPQASPAAVSTPLPEAPASVNVHIELRGRVVQLTLRDSDEDRLLARLDAILQRFPVADTPVDDTSYCSKHRASMKLHHGEDGRTWHSHKTAEGQWCKGR